MALVSVRLQQKGPHRKRLDLLSYSQSDLSQGVSRKGEIPGIHGDLLIIIPRIMTRLLRVDIGRTWTCNLFIHGLGERCELFGHASG